MPFKINDNTDEQDLDFSKPGVQEGYDGCAKIAYNVLNEFILALMSDSTVEKMWLDLITELPDLESRFDVQTSNREIKVQGLEPDKVREALLDYFTDQISVIK